VQQQYVEYMSDVAKGLGEKNNRANQKLMKRIEDKRNLESDLGLRTKNIVNTNTSGKNTVQNHITALVQHHPRNFFLDVANF